MRPQRTRKDAGLLGGVKDSTPRSAGRLDRAVSSRHGDTRGWRGGKERTRGPRAPHGTFGFILWVMQSSRGQPSGGWAHGGQRWRPGDHLDDHCESLPSPVRNEEACTQAASIFMVEHWGRSQGGETSGWKDVGWGQEMRRVASWKAPRFPALVGCQGRGWVIPTGSPPPPAQSPDHEKRAGSSP